MKNLDNSILLFLAIMLFCFTMLNGLVRKGNDLQALSICEQTGCERIEVKWGFDYNCEDLRKRYNIDKVFGN